MEDAHHHDGRTDAPGRLLIVSNRLPVSAAIRSRRLRLSPAPGGLSTGLARYHARAGSVWIGWPGDTSRFTAAERDQLERELRDRAIRPVWLTRDQIDRSYHGYANRLLWPLFHDLIDRVPADAADTGGAATYAEVNQAFADAVALEYRDGDTIWVHDYQLMLLPAMLRARLPQARIGFFLHIPFPSPDIFRMLPSQRRELLLGVLGADLVGFHTFAHVRNFIAALMHVEGVEADIDRVLVGQREVRVGAFPMGVDAAAFAQLAAEPAIEARAAAIRRQAGGRRIVLGVDRLDYTKGIPRRLHALERLFDRQPSFRDGLVYIQVAIPSRGQVDSYRHFRRHVEESVGRINGTYGTPCGSPVRYLHQAVPLAELVALYRAADVMLVTPLRDGMNLVAKEFAASRIDDDGVLVLSDCAGAAAELAGAVMVNPYDVDAVAGAIRTALEMPREQRRARMLGLRRRVSGHDVHAWATGFLEELTTAGARRETAPARLPRADLATALDAARTRGPLRVLLDYDGTLVPIASTPERAAPDDDVLSLLAALARTPGLQLDVVSGRTRGTLEQWFGHLPIGLWAEHGFWHRPAPAGGWTPAMPVQADRLARVRRVLDQVASATPGSWVEVKSASLAWHYRGADADFGARQALDLRRLLNEVLANQPFDVLAGKKVIEVRLRGVSKAAVARRLQDDSSPGSAIVAIGDDHTDEDLFRALPAASLTVAVGPRPTGAAFRVADYRDVRRVLRRLIQPPADASRPEPAGVARSA